MRPTSLLLVTALLTGCNCWDCVDSAQVQDQQLLSNLLSDLKEHGVPFRVRGNVIYYSSRHPQEFEASLNRATRVTYPDIDPHPELPELGESFMTLEDAHQFTNYLTQHGQWYFVRPEEPRVVYWHRDAALWEHFRVDVLGNPPNAVAVRFVNPEELARYTKLLDKEAIHYKVAPIRNWSGQVVIWSGSSEQQVAKIADAADRLGIKHD